MHTTPRRILAFGITLGLLGAACGGSTGTTTAPPDRSTEPAATQVVATPPDTAASSEPAPATDAPAVTEAPADTDAPTTTIAPAAPEPFDLATIPDLVADIDAAVGDASIDPLTIAQGLFAFPFDIPVPAGSSLLNATAGFGFGTDEANAFDFTYRTVADGGVVPDVDITLDGNGPGSQALIDFYDPALAALGFERANSTGSDPGDPGGPNSVNHVYVTEQEERDFNGVQGVVQPVFVWAEEDTNGWAYDEDLPELGGWYVDVEGEFPVDATATPIPVVNALVEQIELPDGLTLSDVAVSLRTRDADSFGIELGGTYTDLYLEWSAPADRLDSIISHFADPTSAFADEAVLMAGEDDFFNEGTILRSELSDFGDSSKRLDVLLLRRYSGTLGIDASDDGSEPMSMYLDIELNPVAPELALPADE